MNKEQKEKDFSKDSYLKSILTWATSEEKVNKEEERNSDHGEDVGRISWSHRCVWTFWRLFLTDIFV
jgi:hypothetical protein